MDTEPAPQRVYGFERFGPPLPGTGPVVRVLHYDQGIAAIRFTGGIPPTVAYVLQDGADHWQQLYIH